MQSASSNRIGSSNQWPYRPYSKQQAGKFFGHPLWHWLVVVSLVVIIIPFASFAGSYMFAQTVGKTDIAQQNQLSSAPGQPIIITQGGNVAAATQGAGALTNYNDNLDFYVGDKYAGGGVASATIKIYMGTQQYDSLTSGSDGSISSGKKYQSGDVLDIQVTKSSSITWFQWTVPQVKESFLSSGTNLAVPDLLISQYTAWTTMFTVGSSSYDGATLGQTNLTGAKNLGTGSRPGTNQFTATISVSEGTDNKGFISSYDPINKIWLNAYIYMWVNGTAYSDVSVTGFEHAQDKGSTMHYAHELTGESITKWKSGNDYLLPGSTAFPFTVDLSGYNATSANLGFKVVAWGNWDYFMQRSSWGPNSVSNIAQKDFDLIN